MRVSEESADLIAILRADREDEAPAELFSAARLAPNAGERPIAAPQSSAGASLSR